MRGLDFLLGCAHKRTSFPITIRKRPRAAELPADQTNETYIVCLECGKKFPYSWEKMKIQPAPRKPRRVSTEPQGLSSWFSRHRWSSRGT